MKIIIIKKKKKKKKKKKILKILFIPESIQVFHVFLFVF